MKNTNYDLNSLPVHILKLFINILAGPNTNLINKPFECGSFPDCLKTATVTPIFKSGDKNDIRCYGPISVVPLLSKIFEKKNITIRLSNYITKCNLISPQHFGFQKGKNMTDAISFLIKSIYNALDNKNHTLSVFLDL